MGWCMLMTAPTTTNKRDWGNWDGRFLLWVSDEAVCMLEHLDALYDASER